MNQTPRREEMTSTQTTSPSRRTLTQNKAVHKWFALKAEQLNECGLTMRVVLEPEMDIDWTPHSFKEYFKKFEEKMYGKKSTAELTTTEINKIYLEIEKNLGERFHVESIAFPTNEPEMKA